MNLYALLFRHCRFLARYEINITNKLQQAPNGEFYHKDTPPEWRWTEGGNRLWYEERPRYIVHYYKTHPDTISVFVNMSFRPSPEAIQAVLERALSAAAIRGRQVANLRLNNWSGSTNAFWYADLMPLTTTTKEQSL